MAIGTTVGSTPQYGLRDLSKDGAVLECGNCGRAVVLGMGDQRPEITEGGALTCHIEDHHHEYVPDPSGSVWNEALVENKAEG